jgi:beta propeller repeat protein
MRKWIILTGVIICMVTSILGNSNLEEFPITKDDNNQFYPAIYEDTVVWQDIRNGNSNIYGYNLSTETSIQITIGTAPFGPAIFGDIIVWEDDRNKNYDIYGFDFGVNQEFRITKNKDNQMYPAIYGNIVVWSDYRGEMSDIYGYNIFTRKEFPITTEEWAQMYPAIYGNIVVWEDWRNAYLDKDLFENEGEILYKNHDIYGYNFMTETEFQITTDINDQSLPAIYGDMVVWQDDRNGNSDIYGYNLKTQEEFQITTDINDQSLPAIYGDMVVWQDDRNGNSDIYGYNLKTQEEFQITSNESEQSSPAIYGNFVIWQDKRNETWDIYGTTLDIDFSQFISQEADFFFERGEKEANENNYEAAIDLFQLAKEKYMGIDSEERVSECDEWIQKCEIKLKKRINLKNILLLVFILIGIFVSIRRYKKNGEKDIEKIKIFISNKKRILYHWWEKIYKGIWMLLKPQPNLERPLGVTFLVLFWVVMGFVILIYSIMVIQFHAAFMLSESLFFASPVMGPLMSGLYMLRVILYVFLIFSCYGLWMGKSWSYFLFLICMVSELIRYALSYVLQLLLFQTTITVKNFGVLALMFLLLMISFLYLRKSHAKEYLGTK